MANRIYDSNHHRNSRLDMLALGSNCPSCRATPDEPCRSLGKKTWGQPVNPHSSRISRAVRQYQKAVQEALNQKEAEKDARRRS